MNTFKVAEDIVYFSDPIITLNKSAMNVLIEEAEKSSRDQSRFCTHVNENDLVHEMLILHKKNMYVRAHKHVNKMESLHMIEGEMDLVLFDEAGKLVNVIELGDYASGKCFYYRFNHEVFHSVVIRTEQAIFHEVTKGPFIKAENEYAIWAPEPSDQIEVLKFQQALNNHIEVLRETNDN